MPCSNLDLSYAPPYNAVHDPVHYIGSEDASS